MQRYWDYSEKDRAELTEDQVESLMAAELMEAGVVRVESPAELCCEMPELTGETWWTIKANYSLPGFAYRNADDAAKAMAGATPLNYEYIGGQHYHIIAGTRKDIEIVPVVIYDGASLQAHKSAAEKAAANKKANEAAAQAYLESSRAVDAVVNGVWDDYRKCQATKRRFKKIVDTQAEYTKICDGDERKARVFLAKAFPQPDIDAAFEWFGLNAQPAHSAA